MSMCGALEDTEHEIKVLQKALDALLVRKLKLQKAMSRQLELDV